MIFLVSKNSNTIYRFSSIIINFFLKFVETDYKNHYNLICFFLGNSAQFKAERNKNDSNDAIPQEFEPLLTQRVPLCPILRNPFLLTDPKNCLQTPAAPKYTTFEVAARSFLVKPF